LKGEQQGDDQKRGPIVCHFSMSAEDLVDAYSLQVSGRPGVSTVGIAILVLGSMVFVWGVSKVSSEDLGFTLLFCALAAYSSYWIWSVYVRLPRTARRMYDQQKSLHGVMHACIDDAGVQLHGDCFHLLIPWDHLVNWQENGKCFLFYETDVDFSVLIPKRCMDAQSIEGLRAILSSKVSRGILKGAWGGKKSSIDRYLNDERDSWD